MPLLLTQITDVCALSLESLGLLGAMTALACGGTVYESLRTGGRVPAVPRESPQHLARLPLLRLSAL